MKRNFLSVVLGICAVTVIMAACGKDPAANTVSSGGAISGGAISGDAVSGDAINGIAVSGSSVQAEETKSENHKKILANIKKSRYANNRNIYEGDCSKGIYQYDLNGEVEYYYNMKKVTGKYIYPEVLWVEDEWLFISCQGKSTHYEIWRIPISKTKSEKRLCVDKWEKLVEADHWVNMITKIGQDIFYYTNKKIYRLNLQTKARQELATGISYVDRDSNGIPFVQDKKAYIEDNKGTLYQLDLVKGELRELGEESQSRIGTDGVHLYYMTRDGMVKYNSKTGKRKTLFAREELENLIASTQFPEKENIIIYGDMMATGSYATSVYYYQDRLYIAMEVYVDGEGNEEDMNDDEYDYDEDLYFDGGWVRFLFSCSASDGSNLRQDKAATEYLWQHSISFLGGDDCCDDYEYILEKTGEFVCVMDGGILMSLYDEWYLDDERYQDIKSNDYICALGGLLRYVLYDPDRGTFQEVQRNSVEFGQLKAFGYTLFEESFC